MGKTKRKNDGFHLPFHSILAPFGLHFNSILTSFCLPFCSIFGPSSVLDMRHHKKSWFSRKVLKTNEKSTFLTPRRRGNASKITQNRFQEVIFSLLNLHLDLGSIFVPFCLSKCLPFCSPNRGKSRQKIIKNWSAPKVAQNHPHFAARSPQEAPKRVPRSPKSTPRGFKFTKKRP